MRGIGTLHRWTGIGVIIALLAIGIGISHAAESPESEEGFVSLFNGKDLTGWDGDPRLWSAQEGAIRGQTTEENQAKQNTFIIWRGGTVDDFELRLRFRSHGGNSGVQLRSRVINDNWRVGGYQCEVTPTRGGMGLWYDEAGKRGGLATAGQKVTIDKAGEKTVTQFAERDEVQKAYKERDWNDFTILAQGRHLVQKINGVAFSELIDEQEGVAVTSGILALQIHVGPPMMVEFKDIRLKPLKKGAAETKAGEKITLFNGKDLAGWRIVDTGEFGLHGDVHVKDGAIYLPEGNAMTGIGWEGEFPREDYEINLDAKRVEGYDFFCGMTMPMGAPKIRPDGKEEAGSGFVTLIVGGWGGMVVGLSNVDHYNASENTTTQGRTFDKDRWYRIRARVTKPRIQVWIDNDKVIDIAREGHLFSVWPEQEPIRPFGVATWCTGGALKNITVERVAE